MTPDRDSCGRDCRRFRYRWPRLCRGTLARTGYAVLAVNGNTLPRPHSDLSPQRLSMGCGYLGEMGPEGEAHAILDWLTGGAIKFTRR